MTQYQDEIAFGPVNYIPAVTLAHTAPDTEAPARPGGNLGFVMQRCTDDHGVVWHQIVHAQIVRGGKVRLRMQAPDAEKLCDMLVEQGTLLDVRAEAGLSNDDQIAAAREMVSAAHPATRFDVQRNYFGTIPGICVRWQDGPSTETVSALFRRASFTRADLRRTISAEHACLLQLLIWSWHDRQPVAPTLEEFSDAYDSLFVRGIDEFSVELQELNRILGEQARAASVHPHAWVREHGPAALIDRGIAW